MELQNIILNEAISPGLEPFVPAFYEDRKKDFSQLKAFISGEDFDAARKIAHNWKGYCEPYGFAHLGVLAAQLEKALSSNDKGSVSTLLFSMDEYFLHKKILTV